MNSTPRTILTTCLTVTMALLVTAVSDTGLLHAATPAAPHHIASVQLPFIENRGQADANVRFYAQLPQATVFVTNQASLGYCVAPNGVSGTERLVIMEQFLGSRSTTVQGDNTSPACINYFKGSDPSKWLSDLPASMVVSLGQVYNGIEVQIKARANTVEKLFYLQPHARPDSIAVSVAGVKSLRVNPQGSLELVTANGMIAFSKPVAYQEIDGTKTSVHVAYTVTGNRYSFKLGSYDATRVLVIDPLLASTFLGSHGTDFGETILTDPTGNVYVAGTAGSAADFPTTAGAYQTTGDNDGFITKFDNNLQTVLSSTLLGGTDVERVYALARDSSGNIYAGGYTGSDDFPVTATAFDKTFGGTLSDGFVAKLDQDLTTLKAATYLGGTGVYYDEVRGLAIDASGNVFAAGMTQSTDFPATVTVYDIAYNGGQADAFAAKMNDNLTTLEAATFFGGSDGDWAYGLALDGTGNVYIAGKTLSTDMPTTAGAYDMVYDGDDDAFVAKFDSSLATLSAATFLNGSTHSEDGANALMIDSSGSVYVAGVTASADFPVTLTAYQKTRGDGGTDGFISKLSSNLQTLEASTFLGGEQNNWINAIARDSSGNIIVTGAGWAEGFPTTAGEQSSCNNTMYDCAFASKLDGGLKKLLSSTYLGGSRDDNAHGVAVDASGNVFVCGETDSWDFPTTQGAYERTYNWSSDCFVAKLDLPGGTGPGEDCTLSGIRPETAKALPLPHFKVLVLTGEDFGIGLAKVTFDGPQAKGVRSLFALALRNRVLVLALIAAGADPGEYAVTVTRRSKSCSGVSLFIE